jgi:Zn-dependent peptidase ImmA (M78 family)
MDLSELIELKLTFGASIMAIMKRAEQLGLIPGTLFERFCRYASQQGWRKPGQGEPGDELYKGDETPSRFQQTVWRAVAEQQISMSKGAALLRQDLNAFRRELQEVIA